MLVHLDPDLRNLVEPMRRRVQEVIDREEGNPTKYWAGKLDKRIKNRYFNLNTQEGSISRRRIVCSSSYTILHETTVNILYFYYPLAEATYLQLSIHMYAYITTLDFSENGL